MGDDASVTEDSFWREKAKQMQGITWQESLQKYTSKPGGGRGGGGGENYAIFRGYI